MVLLVILSIANPPSPLFSAAASIEKPLFSPDMDSY